ncbi:hypothetical protein F4778DRAFT_8248 [Xylariomycetidae sp. FL2044]|nr:hypothetical protein F4778DRAFT_8248 [Xylariomycetidae sp. FL2044]
MPSETSISTPLPNGVSPDAVVASLHDQELYIRTTCPQLISYTPSPSPSSSSSSPSSTTTTTTSPIGEPCAYEVTDKRAVGQTTYRLTLTNQPGGIDSVVDGRAPTGDALTIRAVWRVVGAGAGVGGDGNEQQQQQQQQQHQEIRLEETVEIDANPVMRKMIKGSVEKSHPDYHRGFLAEAARA